MDYNILKLSSSFKSPILWLYALISDRTQIIISGGEYPGEETEKLLIPVSENCEGNLLFGFTTKSKDTIEIVRIDFDYTAFDNTTFSDPLNIGFFKLSKSNDVNYPFRLSWSGSAFIDGSTIQVFALSVKASIQQEQSVKITVYSQKHKVEIGGFPSVARVQRTSFVKEIAFTNKNVAFKLPPKYTITSEQQYINQCGSTALASPGSEIVVHEWLDDGQVSSRRVNL